MNKIVNRIIFLIIISGIGMVLLSMFNNAIILTKTPSMSTLGHVALGLCVLFTGVILALSKSTWISLKEDGIL